ncbi:unnamed protein product [Victoria cruziana]
MPSFLFHRLKALEVGEETPSIVDNNDLHGKSIGIRFSSKFFDKEFNHLTILSLERKNSHATSGHVVFCSTSRKLRNNKFCSLAYCRCSIKRKYMRRKSRSQHQALLSPRVVGNILTSGYCGGREVTP